MSEWQPIETAPKDGTWVLLSVSPYDPSNLSVCRYRRGIWVYVDEYGYDAIYGGPTHWASIPAPPEAA